VQIQLLYFPGCPHVGMARQVLQEALAQLDGAPAVVEIDVTDPSTPAELRGWGSPTILIDGRDVAGGRASGACCRLYPESGRKGAPSLAAIRAALDLGARQPVLSD
jgi:hypothetical protein